MSSDGSFYNVRMLKRTGLLIAAAILIGITIFTSSGCGQAVGNNAENPQPQSTPSRSFTAADIAKLKWLEGTWKGMDGDKPFYERYRFEGDSKMIVEGLAEGTLAVTETTLYELKDGEFGHTDEKGNRAAASSITADDVQFVPVNRSGNSYRFERQPDGTWRAVLEWPANNNKSAGQKIYKMELFKTPPK
jgi:hypothetical protein